MSVSLLDFANSKLTGKDVKKIRGILNVSQDKLSKILNLSLSTITQWERNTRTISRENQTKLLEMLNYVIECDRKERETNDYVEQ